MRQKLNLITLGVNDFDKSVSFFEKGLGWKKSKASVEKLALFQLGGIVLALHPRKDLADDVTVAPEGSGFSGITLSYNARSEEEVNDVLAKVKKIRRHHYQASSVDILKIWMGIYLKLLTILFGSWIKTTT